MISVSVPAGAQHNRIYKMVWLAVGELCLHYYHLGCSWLQHRSVSSWNQTLKSHWQRELISWNPISQFTYISLCSFLLCTTSFPPCSNCCHLCCPALTVAVVIFVTVTVIVIFVVVVVFVVFIVVIDVVVVLIITIIVVIGILIIIGIVIDVISIAIIIGVIVVIVIIPLTL